jgi:hypothetical protein
MNFHYAKGILDTRTIKREKNSLKGIEKTLKETY